MVRMSENIARDFNEWAHREGGYLKVMMPYIMPKLNCLTRAGATRTAHSLITVFKSMTA